MLSLERVQKTLEAFGLSQIDFIVYLYLAKKGPKRGPELTKTLKISKQRLYPSLRKLKNKGIIKASYNRPVLFTALDFEDVLQLLITIRVDQAKSIKETEQDLLKSWKSMKWQ